MNPWKILDLTPEATSQDVNQAYNKKISLIDKTDNQALLLLKQARDLCLQRIDENFEKLMNNLQNKHAIHGELELFEQLKKGSQHEFLKATTYDKSDYFVLCHWILNFCHNPQETLLSKTPPINLDSQIISSLISSHQHQLDEVNWNDLLNDNKTTIQALPIFALKTLTPQTWKNQFSIMVPLHVKLNALNNHYISLKRLDLDPSEKWIQHLNHAFKEEKLDEQEILLLDCLEALKNLPRQDCERLLPWILELIEKNEDPDSNCWLTGPDQEIHSIEISDYVRYLLRNLCQSPQPKSDLIHHDIPYPIHDKRLISASDFPHPWFYPFSQITFLLWFVLSLGMIHMMYLNKHIDNNEPHLLLGVISYLVLTVSLMPIKSGTIPSTQIKRIHQKKALKLCNLWCVSPPVVLDILELRVQDESLSSQEQCRAAMLFKALNTPSLITTWVNQWLKKQPLTNGPLKSKLNHFEIEINFTDKLKPIS